MGRDKEDTMGMDRMAYTTFKYLVDKYSNFQLLIWLVVAVLSLTLLRFLLWQQKQFKKRFRASEYFYEMTIKRAQK